MSAIEVARMVYGLACDCCGTVYVLQPGDRHDLDALRGVELVGAVWPDAVRAGWRTTVRNTYRCPTHVEEYGLEPISRRTWSEVMNSPASPSGPGATPAVGEGAG